MRIDEVLGILWRRKLAALGVLILTVGVAFAFLQLQKPVYASESSLALDPETQDPIAFFSQIDAIIPIYADAATSRTTRALATDELGEDVGEVSVETFSGTSIFNIEVRAADPDDAAEAAQTLTDVLISRVDSGDIGLSTVSVEQIDRPVAVTDPVFPNPFLTYAVAVLVGLAGAVSAALLRESLASRVETAGILARLAGAPCFGEIPRESSISKLKGPAHLTDEPKLAVMAETLRDLRTNLLYSADNLRSVVITSPEGRHGKTTISFGLAVTMARLGARTLLVDADLRRGRVAEMLNVPRSPGLMETLKGEPLEDSIQTTELETLDIITGGSLTEDPGELFDSHFYELLKDMQNSYEMVVIDATPLVPINDARIVASFAGATLLVAGADSATRQQVRIAVERLRLIGVEPTAVVLNKSKARRPASYYSYLQTTHPRRSGLRRPLRERRPSA